MEKTNITLPRKGRGYSNTCMTEQEVQAMFNQPNLSKLSGYRDKVILEVLYSTGIRVKELIELKISDVNLTQGLVNINSPGKWKSQKRTAPIGKPACESINQYLTKIRPKLLTPKEAPLLTGQESTDKGTLFLTLRGNKFKHSELTKMVRICWQHSGIKKRITPYTFRNTCAIHMLLAGADILYIHKMLGQKNLFSGKGYEKLSIEALKQEHRKYHPKG